MKRQNGTRRILRVFLILGLLFGVSGSINVYAKKQRSRYKTLELFSKVLHLIETQYYRPVDTQKVIQGALKGMMDTLDPHSMFLDEEYFKKMKEDTQGEFGGLGIEVTQKDGIIVVITPIDDSPAAKAGIKPGDRIIELNHESLLGLTLDQSMDKMRGKPGTSLLLGIKREGQRGLIHIKIKRGIIKTNPVKFTLLKRNYGYIRLAQFQQNAGKFVTNALKKLTQQAKKQGGLKGIILDLRQNPGGLLSEAVNVSSIFLQKGVVVTTEGRNPKNREIHYVKKKGFKDTKTPLIVLINASTASASEIVAGALQDYHRAVIMGENSFGKGSVQTIAKIDEHTGLKLTIAQYLTAKGRRIQAIGIKPDIELSEVAANFSKEHLVDDFAIRERDLRNHLTATIETPEEKKARLAAEKRRRELRIKKLEKKKREQQKKPEKIYSIYKPQEDFQVLQAINFLRAAEVLKQM